MGKEEILKKYLKNQQTFRKLSFSSEVKTPIYVELYKYFLFFSFSRSVRK